MTEEEKSKVPLHKERMGLLDKDAQQKLQEAKRKALSSDMAVCFNTAEGRRVLRHILNICGYKRSKIGGNPQIGMDVHAGLLYNCAREQVAIELLDHIPAYILKDCEYGVFKDLES
jgi:hypothetical protein